MGTRMPILAWLVVALLLLPARYLRVRQALHAWNRAEGRRGGEGRPCPRC